MRSSERATVANAINIIRFYDLRAKAADDVSNVHGEAAAAALIGHESVSTTRRHYPRLGCIAGPTRLSERL